MRTSALLHMICQEVRLTAGSGVVGSTVARWLDCSKPTALKRLEKMTERGLLERREMKWRSNAIVYFYLPSISTLKDFRRGEYKADYDLHMAKKTNELQNAIQRRLF